jgi:DNA-binding LacI/PurR family transcriptional regulator
MKGIKYLAQQLGLTIGTVSRALNDKPDISDSTRKRVKDAATAIGYVPSLSGRRLRQGSTNTIGFAIELSADTNAASEDFFMGVFEGVQTVLMRHGLDLVVFPCSTDSDHVEYIQRIVSRELVDALIISATRQTDKRIEFLKTTGMPFLALGRSASHPDINWVDVDFLTLAKQSVERLVAHGHKNIAIVLPPDDTNFPALYLEGYLEGLGRGGLPYCPSLIIRHPSTLASGYELAKKILATEPRATAVMVLLEVLAPGLYRGLMEGGVMPGRDIAVVGFRQSLQTLNLVPALTSFRFSLSRLGQTVAETLLANMPQYAKFYPEIGRNNLVKPVLSPSQSDDFFLNS